MRKFSKILVVALTLCLIFGVICTSVSAEEFTAKKNLKVDAAGVSNVVNLDFENHGEGDTAYAVGGKSSNATYGWGIKNLTDFQSMQIKTQYGLDGETKNMYFQNRRFPDDGTILSSGYWEFYIGKYSTPTHEISDYSYVVIDFDLASDEYEYTLNGEVCYGAELPEGATDVKLNYPDVFNFYVIVRGDNTLGKADLTSYFQLYVVLNPDDNKHYISTNDKFEAENDIPLSDIAGAWNHISMVVETDKADSSNSMLRYYCNGELIGENKANTKNAKYLQFDAVRFNVKNSSGSYKRYSYGLDNIACNYYGINYESASDVYGIDDYYKEQNHKSLNLSKCKDIVYNSSYGYYGTPTPYSAILARKDGTKYYSYNLETALSLVQDGDFITLNKSVVDYMPDTDEIKEVTFITESNSSFSLAGAATEFYKLQHSGNRYTIKLASDAAMKLTWYDSEGENRKPIKEQKLLPLFVPNDEAPELQIYGKIDKSVAEPTIQILDRWEWDSDNDGKSDGKGLSSLTVSEINELREKGVNELSLVPIYRTEPLVFEAYAANADGALEYFIPGGDISIFTSTSGISKILNSAKSGEKINIVFTQSASIVDSIGISAGVTANIDLNGKTVKTAKDSFVVMEGATLNLYSTSAGAVLQSGESAEALKAAIVTNKADSCNINIGAYSDNGNETSGDNLTIFASEIVKPDAENNKMTNALKVYVNINGGTYYATKAAFGIPADLVYTIKNAKVHTDSTAFSGDKQFIGVRLNISESVISSENFIKGWADKGCIANIDNSTISGFAILPNVTLGEYNKVVFVDSDSIKADGSNLIVADGVMFGMANNSAVTDSCKFENDIGFSKEVNFDFNVLTYPEGTTEEIFKNAVNVSWLNPSGEVYKVTVWYPGSEAAKPAVSFGQIDYNNGWFNAKYNKWKNVTADKEADDFTVYADTINKFEPIAESYVNALDVSVSLQVSEIFGYNIYLPAMPECDQNVVFDGFYVGSEKITNGVFTDVTVGDVEGCIRLAGMIGITELSSDEITIKFTVDGTSLLKKVTINVIDYVEKVADAYECGSDECKVVFAMMNYKLNAYIAATGEDVDAFTVAINDFLRYHSTNCACLDVDFTDAESTVDYSAIEGVLAGFDYSMLLDSSNGFSSAFTFALQLKKDSGITAVSGKIGEAALEFEVSEFDSYVEYRAEIDLVDLNKVINLALSTAEGELAASYDLAKHIELYNLDIHKALYIISESAAAEEE